MATINVKPGALEKLQGKLTDSDFAAFIGIDRTMLWRVKTGRNRPGKEFIARILTAYPHKSFEDIFFLDGSSHGCKTEPAK
ncbi:MAG: helix-turn-helix transcriptional regulator [Dehalobacterium sp.]